MVTQLIDEGYQKENMEGEISELVDGLTLFSYFLKHSLYSLINRIRDEML